MRGPWRQWLRSVHSDCMGCGIEPRKIRYRRGRESLFARRQHVRHRYARCCRPAGVQGHITCKGIVSEPGRSHLDPVALCLNGPRREGEEPTPTMYGGEKSDQAIVAMKPTNKAERSAAESVERRARAKGNAIQRYTRVGHSADIGVPIVGLHAGRRSAITQGGSRMRESRTYGSVRGALSDERPYRDRQAKLVRSSRWKSGPSKE